MTARLLVATTIHLFGANTASPKRSCIIKLLLLTGICLSLGVLFAHQLQTISLPGIDERWLMIVIYFTIQGAFLSLSLGAASALNVTKFLQILYTLPLSARLITLVYLLPQLIVGFLSFLLVGIPLLTLSTQLGLPLSVAAGCLTWGLAGALGLGFSVRHRPFWQQATVIGVTIGLQYGIIQKYFVSSPPIQQILLLSFWLIAAFCFVQLHNKEQIRRILAFHPTTRPIKKSFLVPVFWYMVQTLRNKSLLISLASGLGISLFLVIMSLRNGTNSALFTVAIPFIAGSILTDLRGLHIRKSPFAIVGLRGTPHYSWHYLLTGAGLGICAALPLIILGYQSDIPLATLAAGCLLGISVGLFAGTTITPQNRDITSQFCAIGLLSAGIIIMQSWHLSIIMTALVITPILLISTFAIEYQRNKFIWRKEC